MVGAASPRGARAVRQPSPTQNRITVEEICGLEGAREEVELAYPPRGQRGTAARATRFSFETSRRVASFYSAWPLLALKRIVVGRRGVACAGILVVVGADKELFLADPVAEGALLVAVGEAPFVQHDGCAQPALVHVDRVLEPRALGDHIRNAHPQGHLVALRRQLGLVLADEGLLLVAAQPQLGVGLVRGVQRDLVPLVDVLPKVHVQIVC